MLSPLQRRVLEIVWSLQVTEGLALVGGVGLIVQWVVDRGTEDLDLFGTSPGDVNRGLPVIEKPYGIMGSQWIGIEWRTGLRG